jgi:hypothetical protein
MHDEDQDHGDELVRDGEQLGPDDDRQAVQTEDDDPEAHAGDFAPDENEEEV